MLYFLYFLYKKYQSFINNILENQESSLKQEEINTKEKALENMEELVRVALKKCSCPKTVINQYIFY